MERAPRRESAGETRTPKERSREIYNNRGDMSHSAFVELAEGVISDFKFSKFAKGEYSHDQMAQLEEKLREAREQSTGATSPEPAPAPAPAPRPTPRTPETSGNSGTAENAGMERGSNNTSNGNMGRAVAATAAALASVAAITGVVGAGLNGAFDGGKAPEATQQEEADAAAAAEAQEDGESFDISDNYRGRFADETGNYTNPNKDKPWNFGESYEYTTPEAFREEVQEVAKHEPAMFSSWYYDLDDSVKVSGTENMSIAELQQAMMEDEDLHRQMVETFIVVTDGAEFNEDTVTGEYTNVYAQTTGGNGEQITSENTHAVHCVTNENGSKVVVMTYKTKDGRTVTLTFREACGLQNIRKTGTPESDKIITSTPEIETPEPGSPDDPGNPDKPGDPGKPDEPNELKKKTDFEEDDVFRDDDAGSEWEKDDGAISEETKTEKPSTPAKEDFHEDTGNYSEPEPASEESQHAEQQTSSHETKEEQESKAAENKAAEKQKEANDSGNKANQAAESKSSSETKSEAKNYDKDNDGAFSEEERENLPW